MPSFIKCETHITLVFDDGDSATVYNDAENFPAVVAAVKIKDWGAAKELSKPIEAVKKAIEGIEKVAIEGGYVTYDGVPVHGTLTNRMLGMYNEGFNIQPMMLFLDNLMDNPSSRAVNELYDFMVASDLPITEDGHFIAYKRVDSNFTDLRTGKFDNSPGQTPEMPRNHVDEDKNRTCSDGLHFCGRGYLPVYYAKYSSKIVMIKINPRDVVAIPSDYDNNKGRACKYYVVKELPIDFDSPGKLPEEKIERSFVDTSVDNSKDTRAQVSAEAVEQLNLAEALLGDGAPTVLRLYDSATLAMHDLNVDSSSITKVCDGQRRSAGGYGWRWATENPNNVNSKEKTGHIKQ